MKKIITYCLVFLMLASILLSACNHEPSENSAISDETTSVTLTDESSEPIKESSIIAEDSSVIKDDSTPEDSSASNDESSQPLKEVEEIYPHNENVAEAIETWKSHDYCHCGTMDYFVDGQWQFGMYSDVLTYLVDQGELSKEEVREYVEHRWDFVTNPYSTLPPLYYTIQYFSITKEQLLAYREQDIEFYRKHGFGYHYLTDRQIELVTGDYSEETLMRELKNEVSFYHDGCVYMYEQLAYTVDDETLKGMINTDEFKLYLNDMKYLLSVSVYDEQVLEVLIERVETLRTEMENE